MAACERTQAVVAHADGQAIDRCANFRYGEKVTCLHQARGDGWTSTAFGATGGTSANGMAGSGVRTPAQVNETRPNTAR